MLDLTTLFARSAVALAAASTSLALAAPVLAAPVAAAPTVLVKLDAADLHSGNAATTVHDRISVAARKVCTADGASLQAQMTARQCFTKAVRSAEVQLVAQREQAKSRQQALATAVR